MQLVAEGRFFGMKCGFVVLDAESGESTLRVLKHLVLVLLMNPREEVVHCSRLLTCPLEPRLVVFLTSEVLATGGLLHVRT